MIILIFLAYLIPAMLFTFLFVPYLLAQNKIQFFIDKRIYTDHGSCDKPEDYIYEESLNLGIACAVFWPIAIPIICSIFIIKFLYKISCNLFWKSERYFTPKPKIEVLDDSKSSYRNLPSYRKAEKNI